MMKLLWAALLCTLICNSVAADNKDPYIFVLGVGQDGGYPQTGCYKPHCLPGWKDPALQQGSASIALIDPSSGSKFMFDATPHFSEQLHAMDMEAPGDQFELAGIFLTHGHIGHYVGLMFLGHEVMGAHDVPVYAMPRMAEFLTNNGPWGQLVAYKNIILQPLQHEVAESFETLKVTPFLVPHRDEYTETVGYRIDGPNKSAIFIPDIDKWHDWDTDIAELVKTVDYALIDATFYADGELPGRDMSKIKHPYVVESMKALEALSPDQRSKVWFIHMNHTNPLLNPQSEESGIVEAAGFNIARQGMRLRL
jgi:pyrroloquinoline quinone biosynthesis protein B